LRETSLDIGFLLNSQLTPATASLPEPLEALIQAESIEEFFDYAKRRTYTSADGSRVVGFCIPGVNYANVVDIARAWDGDLITADYRCVANEAAWSRRPSACRICSEPADRAMADAAKRVQMLL